MLPEHLLPFTTPTTVLDKGSVQLVDVMGDDFSVVQAARVSYGKGLSEHKWVFDADAPVLETEPPQHTFRCSVCKATETAEAGTGTPPPPGHCVPGDRALLRYMMRHGHTTPFEMCEIKLRLQVPMDTWRQVIRQRTASVNEYSTRYAEAIDEMAKTLPGQWRLQSTTNKQGSSGGTVTAWPEDFLFRDASTQYPQPEDDPGEYLSKREAAHHAAARDLYNERVAFGVALEQARKDLPLSNYTAAYWKIDLHNLMRFLTKRLDGAAQKEIREYATAMAEIVKVWCPMVWEAFTDYHLEAVTLSRMERDMLRDILRDNLTPSFWDRKGPMWDEYGITGREKTEFLAKMGVK